MVAIILVNYNGVDDTIDCIKSLSKITNVEHEIIVVDNKSTDDSVDVLEKFQHTIKFTLLLANQNDGFSAGNNIGIKYAENADYYLLLNNDTVVAPNFLENLMVGFEENKNCGATISKILYYSKPNTIWYAGGNISKITARSEHYHFNEKDTFTINTPQKVTFASGCCLCISRKVIDKIGLLNENFFLYEEDADYCCRIIEAGFEIEYMPSSVIYHKVSASTGQGSPTSQFYSVRNKYYLIRLHVKGMHKFSAYIYCTAQFLFRCLKKELKFKYYWLGLKAFIHREVGKRQEKIL